MDHLRYLCLVFVMLSRLFIAALWSPARKGLTSWLSFVIFNCVLSRFHFKTNYLLMPVKSIAECSKGSILNTFDLH